MTVIYIGPYRKAADETSHDRALRLFRHNNDTVDIAAIMGTTEARACALLDEARGFRP